MKPSPARHPAPTAARRASPPAALMALARPPSTWQKAMASHLVATLELSLRTSAAAVDPRGGSDQPTEPRGGSTPWLAPKVDIDDAARRLAPSVAQMPLYRRCLEHYRDQLRPNEEGHDDAGAALACLLAAAAQAIEGHAVTPERWLVITHWLQREAMPAVDWSQADVTERQDVFARWALLAVALGEWSLEASRRDRLAQETASAMARQHLQNEFGLDGGRLMDALRWQGLIPG